MVVPNLLDRDGGYPGQVNAVIRLSGQWVVGGPQYEAAASMLIVPDRQWWLPIPWMLDAELSEKDGASHAGILQDSIPGEHFDVETCAREPFEPAETVPRQLSFLSPIANATARAPDCPYADDPDYLEHVRYFRKRRVRNLSRPMYRKPNATAMRALLRTSTGGYFPPPSARIESDEEASALVPADAATILDSADALRVMTAESAARNYAEPASSCESATSTRACAKT